jgi:hypothetical protein
MLLRGGERSRMTSGNGRSPKRDGVFSRSLSAPGRGPAARAAATAALRVRARHRDPLSEARGSSSGQMRPSDKLLHFMAYGCARPALAAAHALGYGRWPRSVGSDGCSVLVAGLAAWAVSRGRGHAAPLLGRAAEPLDWVFDVIGLAIGIALIVAVNSLAWARGSRSASPSGTTRSSSRGPRARAPSAPTPSFCLASVMSGRRRSGSSTGSGFSTSFDFEPESSSVSSASCRIVNSPGLPMFTGPTKSSGPFIIRIIPSTRSSR